MRGSASSRQRVWGLGTSPAPARRADSLLPRGHVVGYRDRRPSPPLPRWEPCLPRAKRLAPVASADRFRWLGRLSEHAARERAQVDTQTSIASTTSEAMPFPTTAPDEPRASRAQKRSKKRRWSPEECDELPSPPYSTPEPPQKIPKHHHQPPAFWDNLSRAPLVSGALREFNRRERLQRRSRLASARCKLQSPIRRKGVDAHSRDSPSLDLERFARQGGPDLSGLRGAMPPSDRGRIQKGGRRGRGRSLASVGSLSRTTTQDRTNTTKSTGPYNAAFKQHLVDCKVWPAGHYLESGEPPPVPDNIDEIIQAVRTPSRASLEPECFTTDHFKQFQKAYALADAEEARGRTLEVVEGIQLALSSSHVKKGPILLSNLLPLTKDNTVPGNPDRVYGSRPEQLAQSIRKDPSLNELILPTTAQNILCPNFVVHIKGPAGSPEIAKLQAVYDGALAARGMDALSVWTEPQGEVQPGCGRKARTITCTFYDGTLRMFAVHSYHHSPPEGQPDLLNELRQPMPSPLAYATTPIGAWLITESVEDFQRGAAAFRNGLEWAGRQRDELINRANQRNLFARAGHSGTRTRSPVSGQSSADPIAT